MPHVFFAISSHFYLFLYKKRWHDKSRHHATHRLDRCLSTPTTRIRVAAWRTTPSPTHTHRPPSKTNFLNSVVPFRFFFKVQLYSSVTNSLIRSISRFKETAYGGTFRKDGKLMVAGGETKMVHLPRLKIYIYPFFLFSFFFFVFFLKYTPALYIL